MSNIKKDIAKRKAYSVAEQLDAVILHDLGMSDSTLRGWIKEELKLRECLHNVDERCELSRKRARAAKDVDLDTVLYTFFVQQQHGSAPLSGPIVSAQSEQI
ncbi:hypothetical protein HZS_4889 [Henneguya salminicola]|nr:hypothetical protein HZS_4889 [Henneguya salminicola]